MPEPFNPDNYLPQGPEENTPLINEVEGFLNRRNPTILQSRHSQPTTPRPAREPDIQRRIDISRKAFLIGSASAGLGLVLGLLTKAGIAALSEIHPSLEDKEFKGDNQTGPVMSFNEFTTLMKDKDGKVHPEKFTFLDSPFTISHVSLTRITPITTISLGTDVPFPHPTFLAVPYKITDTATFGQQFPLNAYAEAERVNDKLYQIGLHNETYTDIALRGRVTENIDKQTTKNTGDFIFVIEGLSTLP